MGRKGVTACRKQKNPRNKKKEKKGGCIRKTKAASLLRRIMMEIFPICGRLKKAIIPLGRELA